MKKLEIFETVAGIDVRQSNCEKGQTFLFRIPKRLHHASYLSSNYLLFPHFDSCPLPPDMHNSNPSNTPDPSTPLPQFPLDSSLLPSPTITTAQSSPSNFLGNLMAAVNMTAIPPHPIPRFLQRGGDIQVQLNNLYLNAEQIQHIREVYNSSQQFSQLFSDSAIHQKEANNVLGLQGLDVIQLKQKELKDLGNCWSRRWSTKDGSGENKRERVLLQCQCGSSTEARKARDDAQKSKRGEKVNPEDWSRKMPYDFTGCAAHIDITYDQTSSRIIRIVGILEHNKECETQEMQRLPPVPLHPHVWKIAVNQLNDGASLTVIQSHNRQLYDTQAYEGQSTLNPATANMRYQFLAQDSSRLYRMHTHLQGVDLLQPPENNIDAWLNEKSPQYKAELAQAVFHYKARRQSSECFKICIHTQEMRAAA
ncbi:hypothetical protein M422DRAFT_239205 [Sphaerobolus stellatus SS14]|nr:hypothetical protein M422DRAFT_239205 [Sphaerobolus stellatus SS14]